MATMVKENRMITAHNLNEFEEIMNCMSAAVLKLKLAYEYVANHGMTAPADYLMGEAVADLDQQQAGIETLFGCLEEGKEFNPD